jgi:DNA-binding response OmpR family regulator
MLESAHYAVLEAFDGFRGVELFRSHLPQLVITDLVMPEKDGFETVREMRLIDPQAPIIAISAGITGLPRLLDMAMAMGVSEVLAKPFRRNELLAAVQRATATKPVAA